MSSMDRPALIDIRYSTLCSPVHNEFTLVADRNVATRAGDTRIAECRREARDGSGLEHRVGIHGQKQIAAGKSGGSVYCRAAAAARAMADNHVHQAQRAPAFRDGARFIGRAVIHDDDLDRPQGLSLQRRDRGAEAGAAVERRYDHADRGLAGRDAIAASPHAEQSQRKERQRIARNVEYQHREGEQGQIRSGEQLHHLEHVTHPGRPTGRWPNANAAEIAKRGERPLQAPYRHGTLRVLSGDPPPAPCRSTKARASKRYPGNGSVRACECCGTLQEVMKTGNSGMGHPMSAVAGKWSSARPDEYVP